jgi:hypothetical protein
VLVEWVDAGDDEWIGRREREVRRVVDMGVERRGEDFAGVGAGLRAVADVAPVGWSKKIRKRISCEATTSM